MLRYHGKEDSSEKMGAERLNRERLVEKVIGKFLRKLESMVDSKVAKSHIINSANKYGLKEEDYSSKLKNYLSASVSEPVSKAQKNSQKKSESKKEIKIQAEEVSQESTEPSKAE